MRLRITHETTYRYEQPAKSITQLVRMSPRGHDGQFVIDWRVELDYDGRLKASSDAFGNIVHGFTLAGPIEAVTITATGEIETEDVNGVIRGQVERFPPSIFLRETALTRNEPALSDFARDISVKGETLGRLHSLNAAIFEHMTFDVEGTDSTTTAAESFAARHGVCQDYAHIFISAARVLEIPARYVSGYLFQAGVGEQEAGHGWVEALVPGLGWVAFDPANGISPTDGYVRVAVGLDYLSAAPIRGARHGGSGEALSVAVRVDDAASPSR